MDEETGTPLVLCTDFGNRYQHLSGVSRAREDKEGETTQSRRAASGVSGNDEQAHHVAQYRYNGT